MLFSFSSKFQRDTQKLWSSPAPNILIAGFCLLWPTSFQFLHSRTVRSLLIRSLTDNTELFTDMELHISVCVAQTKPNCDQKVSEKQLVFLLNSGFSAEKRFYREHLLIFWKLDVYCRGKEVFHENHVHYGA